MTEANYSPRQIKALALSDQVIDRIYSSHIVDLFPEVELIFGCGDLPYYYLEYVLDMLRAPMFFVHGNHDSVVETSDSGERKHPGGAVNLHKRVVRHEGVLMAGFEGCVHYSSSKYQYSQFEMWLNVLSIVPKLWVNKLRYGRYLDLLVTHSPSWGVNDGEDMAHQGFKSFRWLLDKFKPKYHIHGHIHVYDRNESREMLFDDTTVINVCPYQRVILEVDGDYE